jgi:hypothetical protein
MKWIEDLSAFVQVSAMSVGKDDPYAKLPVNGSGLLVHLSELSDDFEWNQMRCRL